MMAVLVLVLVLVLVIVIALITVIMMMVMVMRSPRGERIGQLVPALRSRRQFRLGQETGVELRS